MAKKEKYSQEEVDDKLLISSIAQKVDDTKKTVDEIKTALTKDYATKEWVNSEYGNYKKILNYVIMLIGTAVLVGVLSLVIKK